MIYCIICGQRIYPIAFLKWFCQYLSFRNIFSIVFPIINLFLIFFSIDLARWKCGVTPHCLYCDSLTLHESINFRILPTNCSNVFDYFVGLVVKGLKISLMQKENSFILTYSMLEVSHMSHGSWTNIGFLNQSPFPRSDHDGSTYHNPWCGFSNLSRMVFWLSIGRKRQNMD